VSKKLRFAISGVLLTWVAWHTEWAKVAAAFGGMRIELWLAAVATLGVAQTFSAWRWQMLARPLGFAHTMPQLLGYYFIGMYFNLLLPTSVGGDVVRAWYLDGHSGRPLAALAAVFLDRFSGLVMLLVLACVGVLVEPSDVPTWIAYCVWVTTACALLGIAAVLLWGQHVEGMSPRLRQVRLALATLTAPRLLAAQALLSLGVQAGNILVVALLGEAIGAPIPGAYYWVVVPMVTLLTMLPVSINGMGMREQAMVVFLAPVGVANGVAVTLGLLWFSVFLAASVAGGLVYLFGHFERPPARVKGPVAGETNNGSVSSDSNQGRTGQSQAAA
jgi:glycosyltransferase 2 family protein